MCHHHSNCNGILVTNVVAHSATVTRMVSTAVKETGHDARGVSDISEHQHKNASGAAVQAARLKVAAWICSMTPSCAAIQTARLRSGCLDLLDGPLSSIVFALSCGTRLAHLVDGQRCYSTSTTEGISVNNLFEYRLYLSSYTTVYIFNLVHRTVHISTPTCDHAAAK